MNRACSRPIMTVCAVLAILCAAPDGTAQPAPSARPSADPALDAARAAFEALPEADRKALQEDLIWTADYSGMADGTFGRQTYDAIVSWQKSAKIPPNGILGASDRATLRTSAQRARDMAGFKTVNDPKTGMRIGVPLKMLPVQSDNPNGGSRWQSTDGKITLDTRIAPPDATLQSLFDRNLAIKSPGRVVSYKVLRPDFFVIAGETPTGKFYTRYAAGGAGIRAFSVGYDRSLAVQFDRTVVAIANSFTPFPTAQAPVVATPAAAAALPTQPAAPAGGRVLIGTGLVVSARQVLTAAPMDRCRDVQVRNIKPQQIMGKGPFLLEFTQDLGVRPAALGDRRMAPGARVLVIAYGEDGEGNRLTATAGSAVDTDAITAPLQPGASGAPVLDVENGLVGLAAAVPSDGRRIAGILPSGRHAIVPTSQLTAGFPGILSGVAVQNTPATGAATLVASVRQAVVPITCMR